jgi:bidirectional [NiFe] hydrogenase diaphorase subunit
MKFVLNGKARHAREGATVLEAARAVGVDIPAICAHDALQPYGACRLCIVEVRERERKRSKIVASCLYPVKEGLDVRTETENILKLRKFLLELLLARSPEAPYIRELAARYGVTKTRFSPLKDACILCGLCVRVCSEIVAANAIGFTQRGISRKVDSPFGIDHSRCIACGACTYVCPTGAIQMEYTRVLELRTLGGEHRCRYTLMGFLPEAVCALNYECSRCEIDQKLRAETGIHPMLARALRSVGMRSAAKKSSNGRSRKKGRG